MSAFGCSLLAVISSPVASTCGKRSMTSVFARIPVTRYLQRSRSTKAAVRKQHIIRERSTRVSVVVRLAVRLAPASRLMRSSSGGLNINGTSPGRVGQMSSSNRRASLYPKSVAPIRGIESPPVATTSDSAVKRQPPLTISKCSSRVTDVISWSVSISTAACSHSRASIATISLGGTIAKQLAQCFFMVGNAMALDQFDEVPLCVACQRRDAEVRVLRNKVLRTAMQVGEVASTAPRHQYFFADSVGVLEDYDPPPAIACGERAHQAGCSTAQHDDIGMCVATCHGAHNPAAGYAASDAIQAGQQNGIHHPQE